MVSLHKCSESCNTADDLFVPSKTKVINFKVFNMITKINDDKTLIKHIYCDCKCKFNIITCNSNQK